ncbi:unnamed protein product [Brugia timori]|uniref:Transmembrane protein n=1 Tax=Brugia timori TaxID=42155 RepID=A0A0R3RA61_9BILA|nr:unnamed protein product [Brugia timori]
MQVMHASLVLGEQHATEHFLPWNSSENNSGSIKVIQKGSSILHTLETIQGRISLKNSKDAKMPSILNTMFLSAFIFCSFIYTIPTMTSVRVIRRDTAAILQKMHNNLRENCFPRPSGGCACTVKQGDGVETVENYDSSEQCRLDIAGNICY